MSSVISFSHTQRLSLMVCVVLMSGHIQTTAANNEVTSVTSSVGQTALLTCRCETVIDVVSDVAVEWTRPDLSHSYVLFYRDGRRDLTLQEPDFENRTELFDPQLTNGDLSMVLKDVKPSDGGTYQCHFYRPSTRQRRAIIGNTPLTTVQLTVTESTAEAYETQPHSGSGPQPHSGSGPQPHSGSGPQPHSGSRPHNDRSRVGMFVAPLLALGLVGALSFKHFQKFDGGHRQPGPVVI